MEKGLQRNAERTCRRLPHASLCSPLLEQIFRLIQLFMCGCMRVCMRVCCESWRRASSVLKVEDTPET